MGSPAGIGGQVGRHLGGLARCRCSANAPCLTTGPLREPSRNCCVRKGPWQRAGHRQGARGLGRVASVDVPTPWSLPHEV